MSFGPTLMAGWAYTRRLVSKESINRLTIIEHGLVSPGFEEPSTIVISNAPTTALSRIKEP